MSKALDRVRFRSAVRKAPAAPAQAGTSGSAIEGSERATLLNIQKAFAVMQARLGLANSLREQGRDPSGAIAQADSLAYGINDLINRRLERI